MITATCKNDACQWHNTQRNVLGAPAQVMCGACREWCELTDPRDDSPEPDEVTP